MPTPDTPDAVPNPYAERPLDDDSAGALAALLFESPAEEPVSGPRSDIPPPQHQPNDTVGKSALSHQVSSTPVEGRPPAIDRSIVEATGTLFAPIDGPDGAGQPLPGGRPLFDGEPPIDPDQPASLRWSTVVHEPTVAEMGNQQANGGRRLFLGDEPSVSAPPRLIVPPPDRYGAGSSAVAELLERRWHWFAVAGVTGLLIGFVAFTLGRGGDGEDRFPSVSAQSGEGGAESVADTVPGGPALAANDDGNTGSFKGASSSTSSSTPVATSSPRTGGATTTQASTSSSTTTDSSTSSSTSDPSSTTSTSVSSTTVASTTTTARPTTTSTSNPSTTTTTGATTTTAGGTSTTADTTTTTADTTTTTEDTTSTTADTSTTEATTQTSQDDPAPPQSTTTSSSTTTTSSSTTTTDGEPGILVVSDDPPSHSDGPV